MAAIWFLILLVHSAQPLGDIPGIVSKGDLNAKFCTADLCGLMSAQVFSKRMNIGIDKIGNDFKARLEIFDWDNGAGATADV